MHDSRGVEGVGGQVVVGGPRVGFLLFIYLFIHIYLFIYEILPRTVF